MRNVAVFFVVAFAPTAFAYIPARAPDQDYFSENGRFVAHIAPSKGRGMEVFEVKDGQRASRWHATLGTGWGPSGAFVSDNGGFVVTCNEGRDLGPKNPVLAIYGKDGLIKNYLLEQVFHVPQEMSEEDLYRFGGGMGPITWDVGSIKFFDTQEGRLCFCIWLPRPERWLVWDVSNGQEVAVDDAMRNHLNDSGRRWSLTQIKNERSAYEWRFLLKIRKPEDRSLVEALLSDTDFTMSDPQLARVGVDSSNKGGGFRLSLYETKSAWRVWGDPLLAEWDGKATTNDRYRLGRVQGSIRLPQTPDPNRATLWVYLVPAGIAKDRWPESSPTQRLVAPFNSTGLRDCDLEYTEKFPFAISTVTPGSYWVKAVLDKTEPLSKAADPTYIPRPGDYESTDSPVITVVACKTENVSIDCTHRVADGTD